MNKSANDISFSLFTRYRSLADAIEGFRVSSQPLSILEVGGRENHLQKFLPKDKITLLDTFDNNEPNYVKGDGRNLPFKNKSFDLVVSTDVLEHILAQDRIKFVGEQLRVAKDGIIISAPFNNPKIEQVEHQANQLFKLITGEDHPWLKEHTDYQLPASADLEKLLDKKKLHYTKLYNQKLSLWAYLVKIDLLVAANFTPQIEQSYKKLNRYYNRYVYTCDQVPPAYRTVYVVPFSDKATIHDNPAGNIDPQVIEKLFQLATNILIGISEHRQHIIKEKDNHIDKLSQLPGPISQVEKNKLVYQKKLYRRKFLTAQKQLTSQDIHIINLNNYIRAIENSLTWKAFKLSTQLVDSLIIQPGKLARNLPEYSRKITKLTLADYYRLIYQGKIQNIPNINLEYAKWLGKNDLTNAQTRQYKIRSNRFKLKPLISIATPLYKTPLKLLDVLVKSVEKQIYPNWELCLVDDGSKKRELTEYLTTLKNKPRIKIEQNTVNKGIVSTTNKAIRLARGEFVILLDHDDGLTEDALFWIVDAYNKNPHLDLIYGDEDKLDLLGKRCDPYFKPDWSPHLLLSQMYIPHATAYRKSIGDKLGWMRKGFDGSQDYDLALRFTEKTDRITHVPKVLYHWRKVKGSTALSPSEKSYTKKISIKAIKSALKRREVPATVTMGIQPETFKVSYKIIGQPLVSIIIPTKDQVKLLAKCVESILTKTAYKNYEIIILDNQSELPETQKYFDLISQQPKIKVIQYNKPFNFSAINNFGAGKAKGQYLLFLNNDTEVINREWLGEMLSLAQLKTVGAVGAKLLYPNNTIQHAGVVLGIGGVAGHSHKYIPDNYPGYFSLKDLIREYSAVTAGCLMIEKRKFNSIKGFDESYKIAFNDVDFCLRLRQKGWASLYTPYARLYHHESISVGKIEKGQRNAVLLNNEATRMQKKWSDLLKNDPHYNPNLSQTSENYGLNI